MRAEGGTTKSGEAPTMWDRLEKLPSDLRAGYALGRAVPRAAPPGRRVLLAGMGGSGLAALVAAAAIDPDGRITRAVRDERLPGDAGPGDLAILVSYSGDTAETLATFEAAGALGLARIAVASGGELAKRAEAAGVPIAKVPGGSPPRAALGHLAGALLGILERANGTPGVAGSVEGAARLLEDLGRAWGPEAPETERVPLTIAREIGGRVPLIYAGERLRPAAERWKSQMNENAKTPAFTAYLPELGHEEIQGWEGRGVADLFHVILLSDPDDGPTGLLRVSVLRDLLVRRRIPARIVPAPSGDRLARLFGHIALADHASVHLAALRGVDPTAIPTILEWKRRIAEGAPGS